MQCPKCNKEMEMVGETVLADASVMVCFRCTECWHTYQYGFSNPYLAHDYDDPPRLGYFGSTDARYSYFKCSKPGCDEFTLIAKWGKLATREIIEGVLGYTIESEGQSLPAYRLHCVV